MLPFFVIVPILVAVFLYLFPNEKIARSVSLVVQFGLTGATFYLFYLSRAGEIAESVGNYSYALGIVLRVDSLSVAFMVLTAFIFLMAAIYSYSDNRSRLFWFLLFLWEASLLGVFLTADLFNVFVLSEVGTVVVSTLILYIRRKRSMYDGMIYLMVSIVAIQFYMFGLGYLYMLTGVLDIEAVTHALAEVDDAQLILPYALMMTYIGFKCALLPLFSWLPKAHGTPGAPPAVSAILSGLYIKNGIYLFLRLQDIFSGVAVTHFFLVIGVVTAVAGVIMALAQTNIKLILAYSTVAQIGLIFVGLNLGGAYNHTGSLFHVFNHAIFKTALFMGTGVIVHTYKTRDIRKIRGVYKRMPVVALSLGAAIFGIIGVPLFSGSMSKYFLMYEVSGLLFALMVLVNLGTILIFMRYTVVFFGDYNYGNHKKNPTIRHDWWQEVPIIILAVLSFGLGIFGEQFIGFMFFADTSVNLFGYLEKVGIFLVSLGVGWLIYKYWLKDTLMLAKVQKFELGFKGMVTAMGLFFAAIIFATQLV